MASRGKKSAEAQKPANAPAQTKSAETQSEEKKSRRQRSVAAVSTDRNLMAGTGDVSQFERYQIRRIHRSEIKRAPYNPRTMSEKAREKLRNGIKRVGLVEPLVWNSRNGILVGGHQRLSQLDALEGTNDYFIHVAAVDMDDQTEKETNVLLNNQEAAGDWDMEALGKLFKEDKISVDGTGFGTDSIYQMFGQNVLVESQSPAVLEGIADRMRDTWAQYDEHSADNDKSRDVDFYLVVVFEDNKTRGEFTDALGLPDNCYVDGRILLSLMGGEDEVRRRAAERNAAETATVEEHKAKLIKADAPKGKRRSAKAAE